MTSRVLEVENHSHRRREERGERKDGRQVKLLYKDENKLYPRKEVS